MRGDPWRDVAAPVISKGEVALFLCCFFMIGMFVGLSQAFGVV